MSGNLGERLRKLRGGLSREKFSKNIGISARALVNYETMERFPRGDIVAQIAARLGVSPTWLLTGEGEMTGASGEKTSDSSEDFDKEEDQHIDFTDVHKEKPLTRQSFCPPKPTIGERIKAVRGSDTQVAFAARLGITQRAVVNYETQGRVPKKAVLRKISEQFGVNPDWLLTGEGEMMLAAEQKIADSQRFLDAAKQQPVDFTESDKNKISDMSDILLSELTARCLRLADVNAALLRENGDLRVEVERQKAELERRAARIADLERRGMDGEREGQEATALARLELENRTLRAQVRRLEQALAAVPAGTDILQNNIAPHAERETP